MDYSSFLFQYSLSLILKQISQKTCSVHLLIFTGKQPPGCVYHWALHLLCSTFTRVIFAYLAYKNVNHEQQQKIPYLVSDCVSSLLKSHYIFFIKRHIFVAYSSWCYFRCKMNLKAGRQKVKRRKTEEVEDWHFKKIQKYHILPFLSEVLTLAWIFRQIVFYFTAFPRANVCTWILCLGVFYIP